MLPAGDAELVHIVDAALADSARRSGDWLACRPGCNQCCSGVFGISALDAVRLQTGLRSLRLAEPARAAELALRVSESAERLREGFPGDLATGFLFDDERSRDQFDEFANDEVCPVLNPATGTCDLYAARPLTCRTFGPPVRTPDETFGVCELCFIGAPKEAVVAAEMTLPPIELEAAMLRELDCNQETLIAFALART